MLSTYDSITSPRRGGVRFVDPKRTAWAKAIQDDPRSTAQIAADSFVQLLKIAGEADPGQMLGGRRPAVRIIVTQKDLTNTTRTNTGIGSGSAPDAADAAGAFPSTPSTPHTTSTQPGQASQPGQPSQLSQPDLSGQPSRPDLSGQPGHPSEPGQPDQPGTAVVLANGHGSIEGSPAPISLATVERQLCDTGYIGILFDNTGQPLDVGREQRLFTPAQRTAMGTRDGGCVWPDCDRPPSWTEAHHVKKWLLEHGLTDLADGVCLCHPHHLLLHNKGWVILRDGDQYWLKPPVSVDPAQTLIALPGKTHRQLDPGTAALDQDTH